MKVFEHLFPVMELFGKDSDCGPVGRAVPLGGGSEAQTITSAVMLPARVPVDPDIPQSWALN